MSNHESASIISMTRIRRSQFLHLIVFQIHFIQISPSVCLPRIGWAIIPCAWDELDEYNGLGALGSYCQKFETLTAPATEWATERLEMLLLSFKAILFIYQQTWLLIPPIKSHLSACLPDKRRFWTHLLGREGLWGLWLGHFHSVQVSLTHFCTQSNVKQSRS